MTALVSSVQAWETQPAKGGAGAAGGRRRHGREGTNVTCPLLPFTWPLSPSTYLSLPLIPPPCVLTLCLSPSLLFLPLCPIPVAFCSPGSPLPHVGAALTVTTHPHISIKSEPVSPSRERSPAPPPQAVFPATRPEPGDGLSSPAGGSYETGDRDDGRGDFGPTLGLLRPAPEPEAEGSAVKRMRLDTWVL